MLKEFVKLFFNKITYFPQNSHTNNMQQKHDHNCYYIHLNLNMMLETDITSYLRVVFIQELISHCHILINVLFFMYE